MIVRNPIRTLSGVTPIALLTKPYPCPGSCAFCPNEIDMPKSYLAKEPAAARAKLSHFDPQAQIEYRLKQYTINHHPTDKIELIILGGTWSYYPQQYQRSFIKTCYDTLNHFHSPTLAKAQRLNEKAIHRLVGLTVETRPDYIDQAEIKRLRKFGVTRVEIGVQSVFDNVLKFNKRGHTIQKVIKATQLLKEAGFKIVYHIMPNLPSSNRNRDLEMFRILFSKPDFQPDMLKIYPCVLLPKTLAYKWFQQGKYQPYKTTELLELGIQIKQLIPHYVRINRFFRDIPKEYILEGSESSNLRQLIHLEMVKRSLKCQCIRCREIRDQPQNLQLKLSRTDYSASNGQEIFLQYVDSQNRIYAFLRLRINHTDLSVLFSVLKNAALIRELHVYGNATPFNKKGKVQHQGLGKKLIQEAEKIVKKEFKLKKIAIISGVGVRNYYRKMGYILKQTYMVKELD